MNENDMKKKTKQNVKPNGVQKFIHKWKYCYHLLTLMSFKPVWLSFFCGT